MQRLEVHVLLSVEYPKKRSGQEMEVSAMEEGEIYDEAGEEVVMEDMDYAMLKNKVM
jgi:hypothetical protein